MRYWILAPICLAILAGGSAVGQDGVSPLTSPSDRTVDPQRIARPQPTHRAIGVAGCDQCSSQECLQTTHTTAIGHALPTAAAAIRCGHHHGAASYAAAELTAYRQPVLPSASFYGYFNSPPEAVGLWDSYGYEVAVRSAKRHHAAMHHGAGGTLLNHRRGAPPHACR